MSTYVSPLKKSNLANRGAKAEAIVQKYLEGWASRGTQREFNRLPDTKAAGRILKAAKADFEFYREGHFGLIEVKQTEHDYRLARDKVPQLASLRKRAHCGGECLVVVYHSATGMWRCVDVEYLENNGDKGSWDLTKIPQYGLVSSAMTYASEAFDL